MTQFSDPLHYRGDAIWGVRRRNLDRFETFVEQFVGMLHTMKHREGALDNEARAVEFFLQSIKPIVRDPDMGIRTYSIELRMRLEDETRFDAVERMMRQSAQQVLTKATLVTDKHPPQVAFKSEDFFEGTEELRVRDDETPDEISG